MKNFHRLLCAAFLLLAASCKEKTPPSLVVVLCDVSQSISAPGQVNNIKNVTTHARNLLKCFPAKSKLIYFPISENRYPKPLAQFELKTINDASLKNEKVRIAQAGAELEKALNELSASATASRNTCILTSIENAYNLLVTKAKNPEYKNHQYRLIILSDLLESCASSPAGPIRMKIDNARSMDQAASLLEKFKPKSINFDQSGINLLVTITSPNVPGDVSGKIETIWQNVFEKMGYAEARSTPFSQEMPFSPRPELDL